MVSCNGGSDGSVTVTGSGGTAAGLHIFVEQWTNNNNCYRVSTDHMVTITDDNGCQASAGQ